MHDFTGELSAYLSQYKKKRVPLDVDFRSLVPLSNLDRLTHFIHPYPAKLLQNIPIFFLNNSVISEKKSLVFDPFSGSGTVALESLASGKKCIAADLNPFACLLSRVKCTYINESLIDEFLIKTLKDARRKRPIDIDIVNKELWFSKDNYDQLSKLIQSINEIDDHNVRDFFRICFSLSMRRVSNADPRISVPVRVNVSKYPDGHRLKKYYQNVIDSIGNANLYELFTLIVNQNKKRICRIKEINSKNLYAVEQDARQMPSKKYFEQVDLIITSPPYPGAQKYIRACSLSIGWLELFEGELIGLKRQIIGREEVRSAEFTGSSGNRKADNLITKIYKKNKIRATIAESYLRDMQLVLKSCHAHLKKNGWMVLIAANNLFCQTEFLTLEYLKEIAASAGLDCQLELVDTIKSYGFMTKRNKSAGLISREGVLLFQKNG